MTESNLIWCDPRASSAGKSGTGNSITPPLGKLVIVTFNGSRTTMTLGKYPSFIQETDRAWFELPTEEQWHSVLRARRHPAYRDAKQSGTLSHRYDHKIDWWLLEENLGVSGPWACRDVDHPNLYEESMRRLIIQSTMSYLTVRVSMSLAIFRFETTVYCRLRRPYSHWTGQ